jgi:hypothetical protein
VNKMTDTQNLHPAYYGFLEKTHQQKLKWENLTMSQHKSKPKFEWQETADNI